MKVRSNKIEDILSHYEELLSKQFPVDESKHLIRSLIEQYTAIPKNQISLNFKSRISESQILNIHFGVKDLLKNKPLQYIFNEAPFLDWSFFVNENVLIPRPETEELVQLINQSCHNQQAIKILDIGTGSGCIAISLQKLLQAEVTAIDISDEALLIANKNAIALDSKVAFIKVDILDISSWQSISKQYDIIVSNPPYIRNLEKKIMHANVLDFEPNIALFVEDEDPFVFYRSIAEFTKIHLAENGILWFEINEFLTIELKTLLLTYFSQIEIIQDFRGKDRFCKVMR